MDQTENTVAWVIFAVLLALSILGYALGYGHGGGGACDGPVPVREC